MNSRSSRTSGSTFRSGSGITSRTPKSPTSPSSSQPFRAPLTKTSVRDTAKTRKLSDDKSSSGGSVRSSTSSMENTDLYISEDKTNVLRNKSSFREFEQKAKDPEDKSSSFLIKKRNSLRKTDSSERSHIPRKSNSFRAEELGGAAEKFKSAPQIRKTSTEGNAKGQSNIQTTAHKANSEMAPKTQPDFLANVRKTGNETAPKIKSDILTNVLKTGNETAPKAQSDIVTNVQKTGYETAQKLQSDILTNVRKTGNDQTAIKAQLDVPMTILKNSNENVTETQPDTDASSRKIVNGTSDERKSANSRVSHASSNDIKSDETASVNSSESQRSVNMNGKNSIDLSGNTDSSNNLPSPLEATGIHSCLHDRPKVFTQFTCPEQPGYVGFANLPNQVHRKSVKKGFEFTLMVVGESGLGKSTLVNSLFLTDLYPERIIPAAAEKVKQTVKIDASTVEIEERGVKLRLTVVDTPGFGDSLNSIDCFKPIIQYVDDQFERYLQDESGLNRRHIIDNRVHCCFYFINPSGHGLRPLDVAFMKAVHHKVNIVPVIAKADTLTKQEVQRLKKRIMDQIDEYGITIYPLPDCDSDEDEDYREQCRQLKEAVPFAVIGANTVIEVKGRKVRGRMYPWGVVEVENPEHCDFIKLRTMLITHMQDLQEVTQEVHYENFRADKLASGAAVKKVRRNRGEEVVEDKNRRPESIVGDDKEKQLAEKDAELRKMQEMLARMQAEMEAQKRMAGTPGKQNGGINTANV